MRTNHRNPAPGPLAALLVLTGALLAGCAGTIQSIDLPADSPWDHFGTVLTSPHGDVTVVTVGSDISAALSDANQVAICTSDQGGFAIQCGNLDCTPPGPEAQCNLEAPPEITNVGFQELTYLYVLEMFLDRPAFTAGGVQLQSETAGTLGSIAVTIGGESTLNVNAGFSEGLIPGPAIEPNIGDLDDFATLLLEPEWPDFGPGFVCTDGTTTSCDPEVSSEGIAAACFDDLEVDQLAIRANAPPGPYSLVCGEVTVNLSIGPVFGSVGECASSLKAQFCSGLKGKAKAACNHAQLGVCHASFNVPSAHAG